MVGQAGDQQEREDKYSVELLKAIPSGTIFSYNMDDSKDPDGMKVRWKVRVVTGREAARWDTRQAEAIREALQWLHQHPEPAASQ
jgi:hypothetical protein